MVRRTEWTMRSVCADVEPGPPSQSLGVDPPDPAVMRRPPRRKDEPILTQALLTRVAFSATIVALGTLFIYGYALGDAHMSRREQTMVSFAFIHRTSGRSADPLVCRRSRRSCFSTSCPRSRTAGSGARSAGTGCCSPPSVATTHARVRCAVAGGLPDGGARGRGHGSRARARGRGVFYVETWARRLGYSQLYIRAEMGPSLR
jgi:hypothetical protein